MLTLPFGCDEKFGYKVFGLTSDIFKAFTVEFPLAKEDVVHGLGIIVSQERRETT